MMPIINRLLPIMMMVVMTDIYLANIDTNGNDSKIHWTIWSHCKMSS